MVRAVCHWLLLSQVLEEYYAANDALTRRHSSNTGNKKKQGGSGNAHPLARRTIQVAGGWLHMSALRR